MNLTEIKKVLVEKFNQELQQGEKRHIIFWYDNNGDFVEEIDGLDLEGVKIWELTEDNNFETKYQLEVVDTENNYLIYSSHPRLPKREDWLLDILLYSDEFSADKLMIDMKELGIEGNSLRYKFKDYKKFFNSKKRHARLKSYGIGDYTAEKLDVAILSALCNLKAPSLENAVKEILMDSLDSQENKYLKKFQSFGDEESFWLLVEERYGYIAENKTLEGLMKSFLITNLEHNLQRELPAKWTTYLSNKETEAIVFIDHWMNHSQDALKYDELTTIIEDELELNTHLQKWDIKEYLGCDTFKSFDLAIINKLMNNLLNDLDEFNYYQEVIETRRTKHWYSKFKDIYEAIYWAIEIFKYQSKYNRVIKRDSAYDMFNKYQTEYYLIDSAYRKFYLAYDNITDKDIIIELRDRVENLYKNWYLHQLSIKWSDTIDRKLANNWQIDGLKQQRDFYNDFIRNTVIKGERVFVIISDALRYEAAAEFSKRLNTEVKGATDLYATQGVVPSYTKLGMATLLPNNRLEFNDKGDILVDGISSKGRDNRQKILQSYLEESVVTTYEEVSQMKRKELRTLCSGKKLVYIYHNSIDAKGDNSSTELEVFKAVEDTFEELDSLVKTLKNGVSAAHIYITADHGFIYRRDKLEVSDKTEKMNIDAKEIKRRVIISKEDSNIDGILSIDLSYIFGDDSNLKAIVPRGVNRFKLQGAGQNFVHGGAALQEIVIPVIKFKNDRSKNSENESAKVEVKLTNISRKVTNNIFYLEFFQTEKVEDKLIPRRLRLYFEDEAETKISNENIIIADSKSDNPQERSFKEKFTLRNLDYQRDKNYYLVLIDEEDDELYEKISFRISLL